MNLNLTRNQIHARWQKIQSPQIIVNARYDMFTVISGKTDYKMIRLRDTVSKKKTQTKKQTYKNKNRKQKQKHATS